MVSIGRAIKWARERCGLNPSEFAAQLGVHRSWVFRLESGSHDPSWNFVMRAAECCQLDVESMRLGCLPDRLAAVDKRTRKRLSQKFAADVAAVEAGRFPGDEFLTELAKVLQLTVEELLYLDPVEAAA